MRDAIRRFGPVLFWQYAWLLAVVLPIGMLAAWIASGGSISEFLCAIGMTITAMFGLLFSKSFRAFADGGRLGRISIPEALRIPEGMTNLFVTPLLFSLIVPAQAIQPQIASRPGFSAALMVASWHGMMILTWVMWAFGGLRTDNDAIGPRTDPGPGRTRSRFAGMEDGTTSVEVEPSEALTLSEAVKDVLEAQYLPPVRGGRREWTVLVDGEAVGVVTQSWEHPRFWRPVEWSADPKTPFEGREVSFRFKPPTTTLRDQIARAGWADLSKGQERQ
ncbi:hypothetical protein [Glycomyces paridis]|uniref:Uncharacterized protein n=1 Tax=Glycomyces paridis TaxID=2126555 RepID=A0A4S8P111_9ACTN|nr:hypothetical protein [Glycomyces paridis]THV21239.1 hypothetical protein E9998_24845 [Glycomyces paridis]